MSTSSRFAFLVIQCLLLTACTGAMAVSQAEFESLVQRFHDLNQEDPSLAAAESAEATSFVEDNDTLYNRLLLATALAPAEMLREGVVRVRQNLVEYLDPAYQSPSHFTLGPLVRLAIGDLLHREGKIRFAFYHTSEALKASTPDTPEWIRFRILDQMARLNQSARFPFTALQQLEQMEQQGNPRGSMDLPALLLRKAVLYRMTGDKSKQAQVLSRISDLMGPEMDSQRVARYWMERAWSSLTDLRPGLAGEELAQARRWLGDPGSGRLGADFLILSAVVEQINGSPDDKVEDLLNRGYNQYLASGFGSRYPEMLIMIVHSSHWRWIPDVPSVFLKQLARFGHDESSLLAYSEGLSAMAELLRREGKYDEAADKLRMSHRYLSHFMERIDSRQNQWESHQPELLFSTSPSRDVSTFYYIALTGSILLVILLYFLLKIRTQRHINRQLAASVEKARLAERAAEASSRLKSQFLANVSHELKTPMSGLVGMASLLDEQLKDPVQRKYLTTIQTCSRNLLVLINDLLDLGRMESGNLEIERRPFPPRDVIGHSVDLVRESASSKGLDLTVEIQPTVPGMLVGDDTRIGQILNNLLNNAIKFTKEGSVSLKARFEPTLGDKGNLVVSVRDTGVGISPDSLGTLFEPFSRLKVEGVADSDGSGLGLAICRKLAELMGGSISVNSKQGRGSTFAVHLPVNLAPTGRFD